MKTVRSIALTMAVIFLLAFSVPMQASAEMMDMDKMGDMSMCIEHAEKIGLTEDQIMKMKSRHSDMQKKHARYQADKKIAQIELKDIMDVKDFDLEKARSAVKKIAEIKTAHQLEMLKSMKEMRTMLTEEQFKGMQKMMMNKDDDSPRRMMMKMDDDRPRRMMMGDKP
jgi:Spy/CpxP family protein refolding chaperone